MQDIFIDDTGKGPPLVLVHGFLGSSDMWGPQVKYFQKYFRVLSPALPGFGKSSKIKSCDSIECMAESVLHSLRKKKIEKFNLLGHSMGGKVAINFAQKHEVLLAKLVIVDIGIKAYPMHHEHILAGIHSVDLPNISARRQADEKISVHIESEGIKQFLLKNLYWKDKGTLAWRMNVIVLEREMNKILSAMEEVEVGVPTLFIRGAMSNYILDDDIESIEDLFIDSEIDTIDNAGHWVHAEATNEFLESLLSFCLR